MILETMSGFSGDTVLIAKQLCRGVLRKNCPENMLQACRRTPMPKCDFNRVAKELY